MDVKWTIAIATCPPRAEKLDRLLNILLPQIDKYKGQIEVLIFFNNFEHTIGYYRQKMMDNAKGEYICHIDDDDIIPKDYCDTIFPLLDGVDYVGFKVYLQNKKTTWEFLHEAVHSLKYDEWSQDDKSYYRGVTHLNPIKTDLARKAKFPERENGEDHQWTIGVHEYMKKSNKEYTEHFIDRFMYIYDHWGHLPMEIDSKAKVQRPVIRNKNVRLHPESTRYGRIDLLRRNKNE